MDEERQATIWSQYRRETIEKHSLQARASGVVEKAAVFGLSPYMTSRASSTPFSSLPSSLHPFLPPSLPPSLLLLPLTLRSASPTSCLHAGVEQSCA